MPTFSLYTPKETFKKLFKGARFLFISPPPKKKKKIKIFKNLNTLKKSKYLRFLLSNYIPEKLVEKVLGSLIYILRKLKNF